MAEVGVDLSNPEKVRLEVWWGGKDAETLRKAFRDDAMAERLMAYLSSFFDAIPIGLRDPYPPFDYTVGKRVRAAEGAPGEHRKEMEDAGAKR